MTNPQLVAHLAQKGGIILVAGGETKDLPEKYRNHPQVRIWDDNQQEWLNKEVPSNTKVIIYTRWISHKGADKLSNAAASLRAIKFPMQRTAEVKELLSELVVTVPVDEPTETTIMQEHELETNMPKTQKLGFLKNFVLKHMNTSLDYNKRGTKSEEGKRIYELARKEGIKTTLGSTIQCIITIVSKAQKRTPRVKDMKIEETTFKTTMKDGNDDFTELDRLLSDAITALKLVQEHMPKVRKETERLRGMREKVLQLFS